MKFTSPKFNLFAVNPGWWLSIGLTLLLGCDTDNLALERQHDDTIVGYSEVTLDANKLTVRGQEAVIGNLITDAVAYHANLNGNPVDFAIINGGSIRFNAENHPDGIYPAGNISRDNVNEMLPFGNTGVVVEITGQEIKSTLERSVHALPIPEGDSGSGAFLQISSQLQIVVDLSLPSQIIDELSDPVTIVSEGERLVSISVDGKEIDFNATYQVLVSDYMAGGGDGFVALRDIPDSRKTFLGENLALALEQYLAENLPVTPVIEFRIVFL